MMRLSWVIFLMAIIGVAKVHLANRQTALRTECLVKLPAERLEIRRTLWEQQVKLAELTAPQQLRLRSREWALDIRGPEDVLPPAGPTVRRNR